MASAGTPADASRQLQQVAAELHQAAARVRAAGGRAQQALGSTATGADRRMLAGLAQASTATRGAQQALSAAAMTLRRTPPKR
jgi:hypothetical protein